MGWKAELTLSVDVLVNGIILLALLVIYVDPFATLFSSASLAEHQHAVEHAL